MWLIWKFLKIYCIGFVLAGAESTDLVRHLFFRDDSLYVLSNNITSANEAANQCSFIGGKLAEFTNDEIGKFVLPKLMEENIPENISVFIGARSDVNQTNWFWENGTMVNDSNYSASNQSVCQQMSLPLSYDDGVNLLPKYCDDEAYYSCEIQTSLLVSLHPLRCSGNLEVSWNISVDFDKFSDSQFMGYVQIEVLGSGFTYNVSYDESSFTLRNLTRNINYTVKATATFDPPSQGFLTSATSARTARQPTRAVEIAYANSSSTSSCIIQWLHKWSSNDSYQKPTAYEIQIYNQKMIHNVTLDLPDDDQQLNETERMLQYGVDLSLYPLNTSLYFMIRASSADCGFSECVMINGTCQTPQQIESFQQSLALSNNSLILLSSTRKNAMEAQRVCTNLNGSIAIPENYNKQRVYQVLKETYVKDLILVEIFQLPSRNYTYKFHAGGYPVAVNVSTWMQPMAAGILRSFRMHKLPYGSFARRIRFCYYNQATYIRVECNNGWIADFDLFGGTRSLNSTIKLLNYIRRNGSVVSSNLFLTVPNLQDYHVNSNAIIPIYIPDISIFTGARSDVNQTNWFWENGTMVNDSNYPTSNQSVCQQMSLPLTYDDGINLLPKNCEDDEAYFACGVELVFTFEEAKCNASVLNLSWNLHSVLEENATIQVLIQETNQTYLSPFNQSYIIIENLQKQTNYTVMAISLPTSFPAVDSSADVVTVRNSIVKESITIYLLTLISHSQPHDSALSSTISARTGKSPFPRPVEVAYINRSNQSSCIVEWLFKWTESDSFERPLYHQIQIRSKNDVHNVTIDRPDSDKNQTNVESLLQYTVDWSLYPPNSILSFMIRAGTRCGLSESVVVNGTCNNPPQPNTFKKILAVSNNLLSLLSSSIENATTANTICSRFNGSITSIGRDYVKQKFLPILLDAYVKDLANVEIFQNPATGSEYSYRYQVRNFSEWRNVSTWNVPTNGSLRSIRLYKIPYGTFTERVKFCKFNVQDAIILSCTGGWIPNFDLFGGTKDFGNTIQVYNYRYESNRVLSSNLFHSEEDIGESLVKFDPSSIYIPDISIFTGARSDTNKINWIWKNGTIVNDSNYPTSNQSVCQQMSLPLTYDDGINLLPKNCEDDEAYFACDVPISFTLSEVECNAKALKLSWNFENFVDEEAMVQIMINEYDELPYAVSFSQGYFIMDGLDIQTNYTVKISLNCSNCDVSSVVWTMVGSTGIGLFEDFINDPVVDPSCLIQWSQSVVLENSTSYKIRAKNGTLLFDDSKDETLIDHLPPDTFQYAVNLSRFEESPMLSFEIQAIYEGCESQFKAVRGTCSSVEISPSGLFRMLVLIGIVLGIAILTIAGVLIYRRRSIVFKSNQQKNGADENPYLNIPSTRTGVELTSVKRPKESIENNHPADDISETYVIMDLISPGIKARNLKEFYASECLNGFATLEAQFNNLVQISKANEKEYRIASHSRNKICNRYKNIYPYDHAVVRLSGNNYINASHIKGYNEAKSYIATQGPKPQTVDDFWEMVWIQKSSVIVMLCNCVENTKTKCEMYWPGPSITIVRNVFKIIARTEKSLGEIIRRTFLIRNMRTNEQRTITQFHFIGWSDHGVPNTTSSMVYLRNLVNKKHFDSPLDGPIIVHCSAGAGRTGTYIAIDYLTQQLQERGKCDIMKLILTMREYRKDMVQNATQYIFLHKILVENYILSKSDHGVDEFPRFLPQAVGIEYLWTEFNSLSDQVITTPCVIPKKENDESVYLNATTNSEFDIKIYRKLQDQLVIMNATSIQSGYYPGTFISSGGPQANEEDGFWEMILIKNCQIVVAMESLSSDSFTQVQHSEGDKLELENIVITVDQVNDYETLLIHQLSLTMRDNSREFLEMTHVLVKTFIDGTTKSLSSCIVDVARMIKSSMEINVNSTALVYCRDGFNKSGVLLAVAMMIERIKYERKIDVFRTVKDLRDYRPGMINDFDDYKRCYSIVGELLFASSV